MTKQGVRIAVPDAVPIRLATTNALPTTLHGNGTPLHPSPLPYTPVTRLSDQ
jgi:hypothetical protein